MAKDVETVLTDIVAAHGGRTPAEAVRFIGELKACGRYQADVYSTRPRAERAQE
jgi:sulfite reductase (NADPH) flavoprotein alpha-component